MKSAKEIMDKGNIAVIRPGESAKDYAKRIRIFLDGKRAELNGWFV